MADTQTAAKCECGKEMCPVCRKCLGGGGCECPAPPVAMSTPTEPAQQDVWVHMSEFVDGSYQDPKPPEPVVGEARTAADLAYYLATQPLLERICAMGQEISMLRAALPAPQEPVADVPSGDTVLPWLPQPDSEGWWWHKFGTHMKPLLVIRMLTLPNETSGALYIPALGVHVDYCGGLWQKLADPR